MFQRIAEALIVIALVAPAAAARADVKSDEKTQVRFEGALGRMLNMFGGKAMKEGMVSTVALKGNRKLTGNEATGQIVDLKEEKVYDLDMRSRTYTVTTFAELRRRMEEAQKKAEESASQDEQPEQKGDNKEPGKEIEVDFSLKETGQKRTINGFDAREVVMTVVAREKGKKLEESGGLVLTTNSWLAPKMPALTEVAEFDRRYAEKLHGPMMMDARQMATALAMYPMLKDAMARMQKENVNLDGTPVMTVVKVEAVQDPAQAKNETAEEKPAPGVGGLGGMLARRMMRRDKDKGQPEAAAAAPGRATVFTMQHEVLKVTPAATDADVAIPAGFKQK